MAESEKNLKIDDTEKTVAITLNPRLYPQSVIMRAAYRFNEGFDVAVDGDPLDKITVTFRIRNEDKAGAKHGDLKELSDAFYSELVHASVEETQARRYADTRNALIGVAVRQLMPIQMDPEVLVRAIKTYSKKDEKQGGCDECK